LCRAAENGKQVTAVVELKARFDEECNIDGQPDAAFRRKCGIGFPRWKTHCKVTLVERREGKSSTTICARISGNYMPSQQSNIRYWIVNM